MALMVRLGNVALGLVGLALLAGLIESFRPEASPAPEAQPLPGEARPLPGAPAASGPSPGVRPAPLSEYAILVQRDAFKSPTPEPAPPPAAAAKPAPPSPLPALIGTIFVAEERQAVLKDQHRAEAYAVGQSIAGGTLVEIEADHVVIERNGARLEVPLHASIRPAPAAAPAGSGRAGDPAAGGGSPAASPGGTGDADPAPTVRPPRVRHFPVSAKQAREERLRSALERKP